MPEKEDKLKKLILIVREHLKLIADKLEGPFSDCFCAGIALDRTVEHIDRELEKIDGGGELSKR